jgi:6-phosphogluconolactonase
LGADRVFVYRYDAARGVLDANDPPWAAVEPGSGPRHLAFHPSGRFVYTINELSSTITVLSWDGKAGRLAPFQTVSTLPAGFQGENDTAEIVVSADGRFVYGSNRGHDSLAVFRVDAATGRLSPAGDVSSGGKTPRSFAIDPTGRWLLAANKDSGTIVVFRLDPTSGLPSPVGAPVRVDKAVCVLPVPPLP